MVIKFTSILLEGTCITQFGQRAGVIWHQLLAPGA